jgi:hypothetical protein
MVLVFLLMVMRVICWLEERSFARRLTNGTNGRLNSARTTGESGKIYGVAVAILLLFAVTLEADRPRRRRLTRGGMNWTPWVYGWKNGRHRSGFFCQNKCPKSSNAIITVSSTGKQPCRSVERHLARIDDPPTECGTLSGLPSGFKRQI